MASVDAYPDLNLPEGLSEDYVDCLDSCGLRFHVIKAGKPGNPLILFCHGFPELAYSWRNVLGAVSKAGFYCIAMDQRGYGRTTGWANVSFEETDLNEYTSTNLVRDLVCLTWRLGYKEVACIVGHDFGAVSSAMTALMRPDIFQSTIQMSHPLDNNPTPPFGDEAPNKGASLEAQLGQLDPPRKHYKWYNCTPQAAHDWDNPPQGLETYLRGYLHLKSADWDKNDPHPLKEWNAEEIAIMPEYYIMRKEDTFPESIARHMKGEDPTKTHKWLSPESLKIYCTEWGRTGFQGALNWYRAQTRSTPQAAKDMYLFAGKRIEVPIAFISGKQDWGNYQQPGSCEGYEDETRVKPGCFRGSKLVDGAGHWIQQEQPEAVVREVLAFMKTL